MPCQEPRRARGSTPFPGLIQLAAWSLSTHRINQTCWSDHVVFWLPPLLVAARQQLAGLEAAGPVCRKPFTSEYWGGVETPPLFFFLHFAPSD